MCFKKKILLIKIYYYLFPKASVRLGLTLALSPWKLLAFPAVMPVARLKGDGGSNAEVVAEVFGRNNAQQNNSMISSIIPLFN